MEWIGNLDRAEKNIMTEISAPSDPSTNVTRSVPPPFFALPSWWRRFLFWTLRPREITVYLYIVSLLDKNGTAFPTQAQVAYEMNLAGTDQIANAMETLERNGFIQRTRAKLEGRRTSSERTIYSRPAVEFTLITLLDRGKIDGDLYPTNKKSELLRDELDTTESAVELGLRNLLGTDRYTTYLSEKASSAALRAQLVLSLEARLGHPVEPLGIGGRREGDNDRYRAWIEAVFAAICERLDGDPEQTGSSRHYGNPH